MQMLDFINTMIKIKKSLSSFLNYIRRIILPIFLSIKVNVLFFLKKNNKKVNHGLTNELILSLTSYPSRFKTLHLTLKCLLLQDMSVDKIILWIEDKHFSFLPRDVLNLKQYGLEIRTTKEDIKSYIKIIPTLRNYPTANIVTVDDDLYYPRNMISSLILKQRSKPNHVIANRTHLMKFHDNGTLKSYNDWDEETFDENNLFNNFFTTGAGVLFPPSCFHEDVAKSNLFKKLAPNADDVWLNWMLYICKYPVFVSGNKFELIEWHGTQTISLKQTNTIENTYNNDSQIMNMINHYGIPKN